MLLMLVQIFALLAVPFPPLVAEGVPGLGVIQHIEVEDDLVVSGREALRERHRLLAVRELEAERIGGGRKRDHGFEGPGGEHEIDVGGDVMIRVGHHEPVGGNLGLAQIHVIGTGSVLRTDGYHGQFVVIVPGLRRGGEHDDHLAEGMILGVQGVEQVVGTVEEPLGDDQRDGDARRIPRAVQFGAVDDVLGPQMAGDQVGRRVVVNDLGVAEGILGSVQVAPLSEHGEVVRQGDVHALLVEHNLRGEVGDDPQRTLDPHLGHAVVVGNGVVRARSLHLQLTHQTFQ
mmetsp:Transcript_5152/g.14829  ORF Transcript_5152/g.14829 Transcript_5152/m.14829 type:complete len:287 (-) Transcript_5152:1223-2083(-)